MSNVKSQNWEIYRWTLLNPDSMRRSNSLEAECDLAEAVAGFVLETDTTEIGYATLLCLGVCKWAATYDVNEEAHGTWWEPSFVPDGTLITRGFGETPREALRIATDQAIAWLKQTGHLADV